MTPARQIAMCCPDEMLGCCCDEQPSPEQMNESNRRAESRRAGGAFIDGPALGTAAEPEGIEG